MIKRMKRLIPSLLLTLALLLTMSTPVYAAEGNEKEIVDATIIFADLHTKKPANVNNPSSEELEKAYKKSTIIGIMQAMKNTNLPFSSVTSAGDAFSVCEDYDNDYSLQAHTGNTGIINKYIREGLNLPESDTSLSINYVWSDHDRHADIFNPTGANSDTLDNLQTSGFVYGAGKDGKFNTADDGNYYVYALSMADTSTSLRYGLTSKNTQQVIQTIQNFESIVATLDKTKPLFIIAHQPLIDRRDDNAHAVLWYESIYDIAQYMDVAYFFGHNHKYDTESDYYYPKTTSPDQPVIMTVGSPDKNGVTFYDKPLNFTHICAGYMSPTTESDTTRKGTVIGITIYNDSIRYATYSNEGLYKGKYSLDVTVKRSALEPSIRRLELKDNRPYYVAASSVLNYYTGYDIRTPSDKNTYASVSLPRPLPGSNVPLAVYKLSSDLATLTKVNTALCANGNILIFKADSCGIYFIGTDLNPNANAGTTYNAGTMPAANGTYKLVDSFENGANYLIVGESKPYGTPLAYINASGNESSAEVSIAYSETDLNNKNAVWTATGNDRWGYMLNNGNYYIGGTESNTLKGSLREAALLTYNTSDVRLHTKESDLMYLYYSTNGNEMWRFSQDKNSSTSSRQMWILKEVPTCCMHAYVSITTDPSNSSCGWTKNTCIFCEHSNTGNFTSLETASPKADLVFVTLTSTTRSTSTSQTNTKNAAPAEKVPTFYTEKTIYVPVDNMENNGKYLLIGEETIGGAPLAHLNQNGNEGAQKVTINKTALVTDTTTYENGYIELNNPNAVWIASGDAKNGFVLSNNGKYIGTKSGNDGDTIRSASSNAARVIYDASADRLKTASGTIKYLYYTTYSGEYWKWATSANSSTSSRNMQIYKEVTVKVAK